MPVPCRAILKNMKIKLTLTNSLKITVLQCILVTPICQTEEEKKGESVQNGEKNMYIDTFLLTHTDIQTHTGTPSTAAPASFSFIFYWFTSVIIRFL